VLDALVEEEPLEPPLEEPLLELSGLFFELLEPFPFAAESELSFEDNDFESETSSCLLSLLHKLKNRVRNRKPVPP